MKYSEFVVSLAVGTPVQGADKSVVVRAGVPLQLPASAITGLIPTFVDAETPAGTISGTDGTDGNATFTLAQAPSPAGSLMLHKTDIGTAVLMVAGIHYNLSGLTITYTSGNIPVVGTTHRASYRY